MQAITLCGLIAFIQTSFAEDQGAVFSKNDWTVARYYCPAGCAGPTRAFLNGQVGSKVVASPSEFRAKFLDDCDGAVRIERKTRPRSAVIKEIEDSLAPALRVRRALITRLHMPNGVIETGVVFCSTGNTESPMARLVSIEAKRILIQFENASFIELR